MASENELFCLNFVTNFTIIPIIKQSINVYFWFISFSVHITQN